MWVNSKLLIFVNILFNLNVFKTKRLCWGMYHCLHIRHQTDIYEIWYIDTNCFETNTSSKIKIEMIPKLFGLNVVFYLKYNKKTCLEIFEKYFRWVEENVVVSKTAIRILNQLVNFDTIVFCKSKSNRKVEPQRLVVDERTLRSGHKGRLSILKIGQF